MMNQDKLTSGINGRLRSRKVSRDLHYPGLKADKNDDFHTKLGHIDHNNAPHLCPYCDKAFNIKQSLTKHVNRVHIKGPNQNSFIECLYCKHNDNPQDVLKHMIDNHSNHYFACSYCLIRLLSAEELEKHQYTCGKNNKKDQILYKSKLRNRCNPISSSSRERSVETNVDFTFPISCELKPTNVEDPDIENNITANVIIPSYNSIIHKSTTAGNIVVSENNKYKDNSFTFNTTLETGQFLSRLGVVHRSQNNETFYYNQFKHDEVTIKFEKCFNKIFFLKVGNNIQENLTKFLDGSLNQKKINESLLMKRKPKKISLNTFQGFPVLLAPEQCFRNTVPNNLLRLTLPKHKSKLGHNESDKFIVDKPLKRDPHADNCIITAISKLDIWTQQLMRNRFENSLQSPKNDLKKEVRVVEVKNNKKEISEYKDFPFFLGLNPATPTLTLNPATLSGEWARPRKYVCCACGEQSEDSKSLASHISGEHPNSQIDFCEIVGEHLQYEEVFKDLYKSSQSSNKIRPIRGSRDCTKCKKPISIDDLHEHILECAGDIPVIRRKCRNRPFGVRRRRTRLPDNTIRKKIRKDLRRGQSLKNKRIKPKYRRADVGDGETIRKMLADLPAKRHRMPITSLNVHKKIEVPRNRLRLRQRITENKSIKNFKDLKTNGITTKSNTNENVFKRSRNIRPKTQTSFIRRNPVRRSAMAKKEETKYNEIPLDTISTSENTKCTLPTFSTPTDSDQNNTQRNTNQQFSMGNNHNKINLNGSFNSKENSSQDGSNNQGSWKQGPTEPNKSNSRNNAPHKVPLKHSIEKITENIHSKNSNRFNQNNILMDQPYITNYTQSTHLMSVAQKPLFEKETVVIKLDKPPLLPLSQSEDVGAFQNNKINKPPLLPLSQSEDVGAFQNNKINKPPLLPLSQSEEVSAFQKNKINKPRKGLNDCIAMLKNKLHEPLECTTKTPLLEVDSVPPSTDEETINTNYEDLKPAMSDGRMILPAHINKTNDYLVPLDLSGKNLKASENVATNLCTKETENIELQQELKEKESDLSPLQNYDKSTPIDLSLKQMAEFDSLDLTVNKTINDHSCEKKVSTNMSMNLKENESNQPESIINNIDENEGITANDDPQNKPENLTLSELLNLKNHLKINLNFSSDSKSNKTGTCKVGFIQREIVDLLGTMPVGKRNTLLDALPEVLTQTVKQLKLAVDSSSGEDSTLNFSSIATQTISNSDTLTEIMNSNLNKNTMNPLLTTPTEHSNPDMVFNLTKQAKVIDLTAEEGDNILSKITSNIDRKPVIIDPQSFRKHKSNEQTASLRAVRIKSSSDKNKNIKHITNVLSEAKKLQMESRYELLHNPIYNHVSTLENNQLIIQHTDVHSTQHLSYSNSVIAQPPIPSEINCILPEQFIPDVSKQSNHPHSENIDVVIPSITQSPDTIELNQHLNLQFQSIELNSKNTDSVQILNNNISKGDEKYNDTIMNTEIDGKSKLEKCQVIPLINPVQCSMPNEKNMTINSDKTLSHSEKPDDDDSEDDISLAVIVKQRQLKENSVIINNDNPTLVERKVCQVKEGKQKNKNKNSFTKKSKELKHSIDDILHSGINIIPTTENNKKIETNKCVYESVIRETRIETNEDLFYEDDSTRPSQIKQLNEHSSNKKESAIELKTTKTAIGLTDNYNENRNFVSAQYSSPQIGEDNSDTLVKQYNRNCQSEEDNVFRPDFSEISSTSNEFYVPPPEEENIKKGETKKRKSKKNIFKANDIQQTQPSDAENLIIINNKTVQIEENSHKNGTGELDLLNSEKIDIPIPEVPTAPPKVIETKLPMAKKQLIFSKLLHDQKCLKQKLKEQEMEKINLLAKETSKLDVASIAKPPEPPKVKIVDTVDNVTPNNIKSRKGISECKSKTKNSVKITAFFCGDKVISNLQNDKNENNTLRIKSVKSDKKKSKKKLLDTNACILKSQRRILRSNEKALKQQDSPYVTIKLEKTIKKEVTEEKDEITTLNEKQMLPTSKVNKVLIDELEINDSGNEDDSSFLKGNKGRYKRSSKRPPMPRLKPNAVEVKLKASNSKNNVDKTLDKTDNSYLQPSTSGSKSQESQKNESKRITRTHRRSSSKLCLTNSDSDDSLSDTPLRNYIGQSSKYDNQPNDSGINISMSEKLSNKKTNARNRRNTKANKLDNSQLTEEQKSEQFMESFGFFSERKPRKSNLIAAKKIAETFHRANESDEVYFSKKRNSIKKPKTNEQKIKKILSIMNDDDRDGNTSSEPSAKRSKRRRKKKNRINRPFCATCQKEFRRPDNLCRHIMSLYHASKVAEIELNIKLEITDTPNLLLSFRKRLDKLKRMTLLNEELKKEGKNIIKLPTVGDLVTDLHILHEKQKQIEARRGLSRDEALFVDCCEMLKESHKNEKTEIITNVTITESYIDSHMTGPSTSTQEDDIFNKNDNKSDGDMDSITALTIMESDEVRNLENDVISEFKEAVAYSSKKNIDQYTCFHNETLPDNETITISNDIIQIDNNEIIIKVEPNETLYNNEDKREKEMLFDKRLPDQIEPIEIFEDKFDKIKRKSRSAAAAKHVQPIIEETLKSAKKRKKSVKKSKNKKRSKKDQPSSVPTKGALKGFDSIKVSEPKPANSEISQQNNSTKSSHKKKKNSGKKIKSNKKHLSYLPKPIEVESKKEIKMETTEKEIDVYEFMDNEDTSMLQFRMNKRQQHSKNPIKEMPTTSNVNHVFIKVPSSSSGSDVDDFVYMSDDYVCSDDETEHSLASCEVTKTNKRRKSRNSSLKSNRIQNSGKHTAVGKIFKNNAVRNKGKRKSISSDSTTVKTNLDQLFDSLLNNEPPIPKNSDEVKFVKEEPLSPPQSVIEEELEAGVALQRARRKCTVGKQNVLAETWSSESETEMPNAVRPNSVESVLLGGRKKKAKRNSHRTSSRRNRSIPVKTDEDGSPLTAPDKKSVDTDVPAISDDQLEKQILPPPPEPPQTFVEQHGWIVGDSHKKLVTMLAHAKGRKRRNRRPTPSGWIETDI